MQVTYVSRYRDFIRLRKPVPIQTVTFKFGSHTKRSRSVEVNH